MSEPNPSTESASTAMVGEEEPLTISLGGYTVSAATLLKLAALGTLLAGPFLFVGYVVDLLVLSLVYAVFAISVDLLWGYAGILTFGHAAFFGFGAYLMAKLLQEFPIELASYLGFGAAIAVPGVVGLAIGGILIYRGIDDEYFTIITLAIAIIANQIAISWDSVTGGFNGLLNIPTPELGIPTVVMVPLSGLLFYYGVLLSLLVVYLFGRRVVRSPFGTTLVAINENEIKAKSLGYNVRKYKALVFGLSCAIAGFGGALYTTYTGFVSPPIVGFILSTEVLIWVLVGGRGTLIGPVVGATFLTVFENTVSGAFLASWTLLLGLVLILIVLVFPKGIIGVLTILEQRILDRRQRTEEP